MVRYLGGFFKYKNRTHTKRYPSSQKVHAAGSQKDPVIVNACVRTSRKGVRQRSAVKAECISPALEVADVRPKKVILFFKES